MKPLHIMKNSINSIINQGVTAPPHLQSNKLKNSRVLALLLISTIALTACGGGSVASTSGGGGSVRDIGMATAAQLSSIDETVAKNAIAKIARNAPKQGSVTQTNRGTGSDPTTTDSIEVDVTLANGKFTYTATREAGTVASPDTRIIRSSDSEVIELRRFRGGDEENSISQVGLFKEFAGEGKLWVEMFTTRARTETDDDYLAGGIWLYVPESLSATNTNDFEIGAFVDGNDIFTQANLAALTSSATYEGQAVGLAVDPDKGDARDSFFGADLTLTADFGDASALGSISGTLTKFVSFPNQDDIDGLTMTLETANIGSDVDSGGFFTGDTSVSFNGAKDSSYDGKWGGQFYSNPASSATGDDAHPGSVAGTFGGTDGSKSFIGVFDAYKK